MKTCPSWTDSQNTTRSRCILMAKSILLLELHCNVLLHIDAFWIKECGCHLLAGYEKIFQQHSCKIVKCYIDDTAFKSRAKKDHQANLIDVFDLLQAHELKMNLLSPSWGVHLEILNFVIILRGIHLASEKIEAIQEM